MVIVTFLFFLVAAVGFVQDIVWCYSALYSDIISYCLKNVMTLEVIFQMCVLVWINWKVLSNHTIYTSILVLLIVKPVTILS